MIKGKLIKNIRWALHEPRLYCIISDPSREDAFYYFESGIGIYNASPN
jgi:hypothetical protein